MVKAAPSQAEALPGIYSATYSGVSTAATDHVRPRTTDIRFVLRSLCMSTSSVGTLRSM